MKALAIEGYETDDVKVMDVPEAEPGPGEIAVHVRAAALNRLDLWTVSGALKIEHSFPHVLGADAAAEVLHWGRTSRAPSPAPPPSSSGASKTHQR